MILINGEKWDVDEIALAQYLEQQQINPARIAVEWNGDILPKSQYASAVFKDGDTVEIVNFVGGG